MTTPAQHWKNIYQTRDHQKVGWYQQSPDISLQLLSRIGAQPTQSIIDAGCGASVLVDHLIDQGYTDITLLDLSSEALEIIRQRLAAKAHIPHYLSQDLTTLTFHRTFDIWHDRAVFHFLQDTQQRHVYMSNLMASLSSTGRAIIGTFSLDGPNSCSGLDVVQYNRQKMQAELTGDLEIEDTLTSTHTMPSGAKQQYIYFIIRHAHA